MESVGIIGEWAVAGGRKQEENCLKVTFPPKPSEKITSEDSSPRGAPILFGCWLKFFSRGCVQAISWGLVVAGAYIGGGAVVFRSEDFGCARYGGCAFATYIIEGSLKFWRKMATAWEKSLKVS